jgi:PII-like signaling protein
MRLSGFGKRLTVYLDEGDRHHRHSLADAIIQRAREEGLAGATGLRGVEGFGESGRVHTDRIVDLTIDLPVVVLIVDEADRIDGFLPILRDLAPDALATIDEVEVVLYRGVAKAPLDDVPG